jgi:predicted nucleotidyltransferase component of viral defense system
MIPKANIIEWRMYAPWPSDEQVEQDLLLSRIICELYSDERIVNNLAFRGGTALHKLFLKIPGRYSEDVDLVQINEGPIGGLVDAVRAKLDPWLGEPRRKLSEGRFTLYYRFLTETEPQSLRKVKIEINTREHFSIMGASSKELVVKNRWFNDKRAIGTYFLEELLATKMRALYQRKKGRDLFDIWLTLQEYPELNTQLVVNCFLKYMDFTKLKVSRVEFERNLFLKRDDIVFRGDINNLLARDFAERYQVNEAADIILSTLVVKI